MDIKEKMKHYFRLSYPIKVYCFNCKEEGVLKIPLGKKINYYLKTPKAVCENCKCKCLMKLLPNDRHSKNKDTPI